LLKEAQSHVLSTHMFSQSHNRRVRLFITLRWPWPLYSTLSYIFWSSSCRPKGQVIQKLEHKQVMQTRLCSRDLDF